MAGRGWPGWWTRTCLGCEVSATVLAGCRQRTTRDRQAAGFRGAHHRVVPAAEEGHEPWTLCPSDVGHGSKELSGLPGVGHAPRVDGLFDVRLLPVLVGIVEGVGGQQLVQHGVLQDVVQRASAPPEVLVRGSGAVLLTSAGGQGRPDMPGLLVKLRHRQRYAAQPVQASLDILRWCSGRRVLG